MPDANVLFCPLERVHATSDGIESVAICGCVVWAGDIRAADVVVVAWALAVVGDGLADGFEARLGDGAAFGAGRG